MAMAMHHILLSSVSRLFNTIISSIHSLILCTPGKINSISTYWANFMLIYLIYDILTYRVIIMPHDVIDVTDVGYGLLLVFCQAINQTNNAMFFVNSTFRNKFCWKNTQVFFLENMFEIDVCKMAAILFRPQVARGEIKLLNQPKFLRLTKSLS